ncbi:histidine kinase [Actinoplanes sp. NBC_00393]|uniref:sensor histidine kinase n=1 Tax=Actinoplanes sp. NBC_00393 TaxID=2975953 RepID=UPI002E1CA93D
MPGTSNHRAAATTVAAVALLTAVIAVVMLPFSGTEEAWTEWFYLNDVIVAVVYGLLAGLLLSRGARTVGALAGLAAIGCGLAAIGQRYPLLEVPGGPPFAEQLLDVVGTAWVPGTLALITVVPWLVRDDRLPRHARVAVAAGATVSAAITLARVIRPVNGVIRVGSPEWDAFVENTLPVQMGVVVLLGLWATGDAVLRWRRLPEDRRRGLGWLAIGSALMALSFVPLALPLEVSRPIAYASVTPILQMAAQAFFPAATLAVVLRQRLWGIDVAVSRTLVWSLLTAVSVAAYVLLAQGVVALVPLPDGTAGAVAAAVLAMAVFPARTWLQDRVDHLVRGPSARPGTAAERLARRIGSDAAGPVEGALEAIRESLRLHSVRLEIPDRSTEDRKTDEDGTDSAAEDRGATNNSAKNGAADVQVLAAAGDPGGPPLTVDLSYGGAHAGWLVVTGAPGEKLDARTKKDLAVLAGPVAAVAQLAVRTGELDAARARTTAARVEERRLLRRELHDRLGPTLVGVGLTVRGARNLLDTGRTAEAAGMLDQLRVELDRSAEDVRTLARALLPPSLERHGLGAAVSELAGRLGGPDLAVTASVSGDTGDLPPELAAGLYGIAAEALVNARRHARADSATVRLAVDGGNVVLEVADDGRGLDGAAEPGIGLRSMRERTEELGGTLALGTAVPRGTLVRVVVPR